MPIRLALSGVLEDEVPVGTIVLFAGSVVPEGWLLCDGSAVSRTQYARLFQVIGTTYGAGDGSTTFNLPNLRGRVPVGLDTAQSEFDTLGKTGGVKSVTLTVSQMPAHDHGIASYSISNDVHSHSYIKSRVYTNFCIADGSSYAKLADDYTSYTTSSDGSHSHSARGYTDNTGGGQAHNNLQPYLVLNCIIKY